MYTKNAMTLYDNLKKRVEDNFVLFHLLDPHMLMNAFEDVAKIQYGFEMNTRLSEVIIRCTSSNNNFCCCWPLSCCRHVESCSPCGTALLNTDSHHTGKVPVYFPLPGLAWCTLIWAVGKNKMAAIWHRSILKKGAEEIKPLFRMQPLVAKVYPQTVSVGLAVCANRKTGAWYELIGMLIVNCKFFINERLSHSVCTKL